MGLKRKAQDFKKLSKKGGQDGGNRGYTGTERFNGRWGSYQLHRKGHHEDEG